FRGIVVRFAAGRRLTDTALAAEDSERGGLGERRARCYNDDDCKLLYHVMRAVYCNTRAPCAELRKLMIPSVLGVPIPGWLNMLNASRLMRSFTRSVMSTLL